MRLLTGLAVALALFPAQIQAAHAEVKPNPVFSDNAVLQKGMMMPVWGTADDGERVTVSFQDQRVSTTARSGSWMVKLRPLKQGGPFTMTVSGKNTVEIKNLLVGEVWFASGQSNMAFPLSKTEDGEKEAASSADPLLRLGTITRGASSVPLTETAVNWEEAGPQTSGDFSAVAYYFGKQLRKILGCPVGLLDGARGGTRIEAWMSEEALKPFEGQYDVRKPKNGSDSANWNTASALWNGVVAPLVPYPIRGVIWYQGEANAGNADLYRKTFPAMIRDWRKAWGSEYPFLFVQLAPYQKIVTEPQESAWAELRDAQLFTSQTVPNTAMAVITDCGDPNDIHPKRKEPVGYRLALAAEALAYGMKTAVYKGPAYRSMSVVGDRAVLQFDNAYGGLVAKGDNLTGFTIAGEDHRFHNARATILGSRVVVSSDAVDKPVAVRYGWANCPVVNIFNRAGLPASPFRTDSFSTKPEASIKEQR